MFKHLSIAVAMTVVVGCTPDYASRFDYSVPADLNDSIVVGTIHEAGLDTLAIGEAVERLRAGRYKEVHSLLIYKSGNLVLEEYFPGYTYEWDQPRHRGELAEWSYDRMHHVQSVTKSITSLCIGIAVDKGYIDSVDDSIFKYLPEHQHLRTPERAAITIKHLLTMSSGLSHYEWSAPYSSRANPVIGIWYSEQDPVSFILDAKVDFEPGSQFIYYGGSQVLLGEILRHATGIDIDEFSGQHLFAPLGIVEFEWAVRHDNGVIEAAGGLKMTPRGMLKLGIMSLNNGDWDDTTVVSDQWLSSSLANYGNREIDIPGTDGRNLGYGFSWWLPNFLVDGRIIEAYAASGWGGQKIVVIPEEEMVIVFTGGAYTTDTRQYEVIQKYILAAIQE